MWRPRGRGTSKHVYAAGWSQAAHAGGAMQGDELRRRWMLSFGPPLPAARPPQRTRVHGGHNAELGVRHNQLRARAAALRQRQAAPRLQHAAGGGGGR